jgi:prevent-host-death family protein
MKEMSASEASRNFSAVLDQAEHGETIVVTRAGRRVALIAPAPRANARALLRVFSKWQGNPAFDDSFAAHVASAREVASSDEDTDPWRD